MYNATCDYMKCTLFGDYNLETEGYTISMNIKYPTEMRRDCESAVFKKCNFTKLVKLASLYAGPEQEFLAS